MTPAGESGLYLMHISPHGLIRGSNLELGRDADTGGQTKYVIELTRALAKHPGVGRVDLLTRRVIDSSVDDDYRVPEEALGPGARLIRIACGPRRYLRKEVLWPHLDAFADNALQHIRKVGRIPDLIHGHYADAGYVASLLADLLGLPMYFTGHSLGRVKQLRLLEKGLSAPVIESRYNIEQRIEAEEIALDCSACVIASTQQEVEEQYKLYDNYAPQRMTVIPPGVDLTRFRPPARTKERMQVEEHIVKFLRHPGKPMICAIALPDERKNLHTLVRAYGESKELQELANLVIVAGIREDIPSLEKGPREVLTSLLMLIDRYDLYGKIAYPKYHEPDEVPNIYRLAAKSRGVFVNPALTEPFGLTLLEAAATGLPILATRDGGPRNILAYCRNGVLIDPLDVNGIKKHLVAALSDSRQWLRWSQNGLRGVRRHFSWAGHARTYVDDIHKRLGTKRKTRRVKSERSRMPIVDRVLVCDVDNTLIGDPSSLTDLLGLLGRSQGRIGFGIATGRHLESAKKVLSEWRIPVPDFLVTCVGTEIHYGHRMTLDHGWQQQINYRWEPEAIRATVKKHFPELVLQSAQQQTPLKISFVFEPESAPDVPSVIRRLRNEDLHAKVIASHDAYLDIIPLRASKGSALRYLAMKWGIPLERFLVAGDSGNDEDMLKGNTLGIVVGNHSPELERLRGKPRIYFAKEGYAAGIIEGIGHYDFQGDVRAPDEDR